MSEGPGIYVFRDRAGEYRWRLRAANMEIVADSAEGYTTRSGALEAVDTIRRLMHDPRLHVHEETE